MREVLFTETAKLRAEMAENVTSLQQQMAALHRKLAAAIEEARLLSQTGEG